MYEYTRRIYRISDGAPLNVVVNKVGGGTVGESYDSEYWDARIYDAGKLVWESGPKLYIGGSTDHKRAAYLAVEWYEDTFSE